MRKLLKKFCFLLAGKPLVSWKHLSLMLLISNSIPFIASAQNIQWNKTIGADLSDYLTTARQTSDGGYILGGISGSGKNGDKSQPKKGQGDFWIVKLNANGSKVWDKTIGSTVNDRLDALQQTKDGGYILLGYSVGGISGDKTSAKENWVVKLNPDGTKAWDKTFGVQEGGGSLTELQQTSDGGYILGGSAYGVGGDKTEAGQFSDFWIVKLNADGSKVWDETITGNNSDGLTSLQQTQDGGFILGGYSDSGKGFDKSEGPKNDGNTKDFWIVKLNSDRTIAWDKTIGVEEDDLLSTIQQTQDGGYIIGGYADAGIGEFKAEKSKGGFDYWVIKLNEKGNQEWNKTIGGSASDQLHALQPTNDGGYILGGGSRSSNSGDKTQDNQGMFDYWVVKLNANGSKAWDLTLGGNAEDALETVFQTKDNGYFVGGHSKSSISGTKTEASKGGFDYWVVKLDNNTKAKQTVSFPALPEVNFAAKKTITLKATASSGLPVGFRVVSGPATVKGIILTLTGGSGTVTLEAFQPGNTYYYAAPAVSRSFVVQVPPVTRLWDKAFGGIRTEYQSQGNVCDEIFGSSYLAAMVQTSDGGYLLGGTSDSKKGNDKSADHKGTILEDQCFSDQQPIADYWIVKTNANGEKLWDKTFGGNDRDELKALVATSDGGYLLGGSSKSDGNGNKTQASRGYEDFWVVKIDANGNKIWDKTFGGNLSDALTSLVATPDGNYLLGGTSISGKSGDKTEAGIGGQEFWLVKIDGNGNKIWDKAYDNEGNDLSTLQAMITSPDGGFLLGGTTSLNKSNYWVVKINDQGQKLWDKTFGGNEYDHLNALATTVDGGYLLGGYSNSDKSGDKSETSRSGNDYWLVKIDGEGKKVWDKTIGGNGTDQLTALIKTPDEGFLLGGTSNSGISGEKSEDKRGSDDYWTVKIDAAGNKLWDRTLGGTSDSEQLSSLLVTSNGHYLIGGSSYSKKNGDKSQPLKGVRDFWLVKIKEEAAPEKLAWDMRYGGSGTDNLTDVIKTSDGGYLSAGYTDSGVSGDKTQSSRGKNDYWIVKSDKNGKKLWDKRYGGDQDDFLNRVLQTSDGGYLLAGSSLSGKNGDKSEESRGDRDYWIVKVDQQGNKQWDKTLGGNGSDELKKVMQLSSGEFVLGGHSNSSATGDKSQPNQGGKDYWLVKISSTGTKLWDKRYGGNANDVLGSFTLTHDQGFVLVGSSISANGDKTQPGRGNLDYWVVKTDKEGNLLWEKTIGGQGKDEAYSVGRSGEDLFIAGTSASNASNEKTQDSRGGKDYWLVKLNKNGNQLWDKTFGGSQDEELRASTFTDQGHYVLAGSSSSGASGDKSQASQGATDYWVVEVDESGNQIHDQRFGGSGTEELRTVTQTWDGGLLLGGRSDSGVSGDKTQPSQGGTDYWLVKIAPATTALVAERTATLVPAPAASAELNSLTAFPNPAKDQVTVQFTLPQTQTTTVKIYDSQGREVSTLFQGEAQAKQTYQVEWQAGNKPTGLYFLQLQTPTLRQQQKLLLSK